MRTIPAVPLTYEIFVRLKHFTCENTLQITVKNYKNTKGGLVMIYITKINLGVATKFNNLPTKCPLTFLVLLD